MDRIDKLFYINLERRPDRNTHFLNECAKIHIPNDKIERYNAIDGSKMKNGDVDITLFKNADYMNKPFANNIIGNQLSHFNILKEMVHRNYNYIMVCQDDVIFRDDFLTSLDDVLNSAPDNTEIINIGFNKRAVHSFSEAWDFNELNTKGVMVNEHICKLYHYVNPCSMSYIVTRQGAINMIEWFHKTGFLRSTDHNYNQYLISKDIFYGSIKVLCTGNPQLGSDVFV